MKTINEGDHVKCTIRGMSDKLVGSVYAIFEDGYVGVQDVWRNAYTIHSRYVTVTTPASYFAELKADFYGKITKGCYA